MVQRKPGWEGHWMQYMQVWGTAAHCPNICQWVNVATIEVPADSAGFPVESQNSMGFLWEAFAWSLSHLGFHFHGNSHLFPRNSNENGRNMGEPLGMISSGMQGIPLEFHGKQLFRLWANIHNMKSSGGCKGSQASKKITSSWSFFKLLQAWPTYVCN